MKVLLVAHQLPPRHLAGTEIYTMRLAHALAARHDVVVFASDGDPGAEPGGVRERIDGAVRIVEVATSRMAEDAAASLESPLAESAFEDLVKELRPDVAHFQHLRFLSLRLPAIAKRSGVATLMTLHDYWLVCAREGQLVDRRGAQCDGPAPQKCADCLVGYRFGLSKGEARAKRTLAWIEERTGLDLGPAGRRVGLLARRFRRKSRRENDLSLPGSAGNLPAVEARCAAVDDAASAIDTFIAPSKFLEGVFLRAGFDPRRFRVVGHGVDGPRPGVTTAPSRSGRLRIGFAGTITPHKGVDLLIRAASAMPKDAFTVDVHGVDDVRPEYASPLKRAARGLPIRFHGAFVPGTAVDIMKSWDVAVVPSRWVENQPLVILEAFAAGVPVVAADLGGMRELVKDGVNGRLFAGERTDHLTEILTALSRDRNALAALRSGVTAPPSLAEHAAAVESLYHGVTSS